MPGHFAILNEWGCYYYRGRRVALEGSRSAPCLGSRPELGGAEKCFPPQSHLAAGPELPRGRCEVDSAAWSQGQVPGEKSSVTWASERVFSFINIVYFLEQF